MNSAIINHLKKYKGTSGYVKWLIHYTKPYLPKLLLMMVLTSVTSAISVGLTLIGKYIIDDASAGKSVTLLILFYVGVVILIQIIGIVTGLMSVMINERFSFGVRKQVFEKILNSTYCDIEKYHTGDLMTRFTSDCTNIANGIANVIPSIIQLVIEFIITFVVLYISEPMLAVVAVLIAPIGALVTIWFGKKLKVLQAKVQESESTYRSFITECLSNILIIKTFCSEEESAVRLSELREERFYWVYKRSKLSQVTSTSMSLAFQGGYIVALSWGAKKLADAATNPLNTFTYGTMSVFLTLVSRIQSPIVGLAHTIPDVVSVLTSVGRIMELQNLPIEERVDSTINHKDVGVEIKNLTFGYTDEILLHNTELNIRPGEFVAIVGESGIGKTTLVRLIMSFIKASEGTVEFTNGDAQREKSNASSREFLSYVPQGNTLFSGSIRHNILMGRRDATEDEIIEALKAASAYNFVMELPQGLDTVIGERGFGISEGQAQRISIARAFIKKAPFLLLDEATSSLDEKTELAVLQGLRDISPRPTCLLITHRRSVLKYCDREIKIENNKLCEIDITSHN